MEYGEDAMNHGGHAPFSYKDICTYIYKNIYRIYVFYTTIYYPLYSQYHIQYIRISVYIILLHSVYEYVYMNCI